MASPPKISLYVGCMNAINTVAHILMGGALFLTFALADGNDPALYKAHACMTILGVTLLCSQAILSVNPYVGFEDNFMYPQKSKTYWLIQILGSVLVLIGACIGIALVSETTFGFELPFPTPGLVLVQHLQTSHGIIGLLVLLLAAVSLFTLLWSQALLSVNPQKGFEHNFVYPKKSQKYWIIQIIGHATAFSGTYLGISAVSESREHIINGVSVQHLGTTHGLMGLVIMLLTAVNLVGASANLLKEQPINGYMNTLYVVVGTVTLIMAYIVICMHFFFSTTPLGYDSSLDFKTNNK
ncbi:uncharacterized protein LOC111349692 [Spodoptera litura]|uniref:Uncharacterized protein LOC111349692 n=1 Tax=Spodoptera litura TaxID=69820 RepID=A0A9J7DUS3_SPOLT|nr:uncharacterized protein LOC111349692 [Spodoptera litura]